MRFAIMTWVPIRDNAKVGTIFGILDTDAQGFFRCFSTAIGSIITLLMSERSSSRRKPRRRSLSMAITCSAQAKRQATCLACHSECGSEQ